MCMFVGKEDHNKSVKFYHKPIKIVKEIKNLGIILNNKLKWNAQIDYLSG